MPRYRIELTDTARSQLRDALAWWREHRPESPDLLAVEVRGAVAALRETPAIGALHPRRGFPGLRKVVLHRSKRAMFYVVDQDQRLIQILAVWGTARGKGPTLK